MIITWYQLWIRVYSHKTHNFDFHHHDGKALFSLAFLLLSFLLLILLLLLSLLLFSLLLPLFLFLLSVCSFAFLHLPIHLLPIPCSVLRRIIHDKNSFWCRRNIHGIRPLSLKAMSWTASLPFNGHFCLETNIFNASLETEYDLFQNTFSMYRGYKHIIRFSPTPFPITGGFGKDFGGHSLITDLLQAAKSVWNCALVFRGSGLRLPTNVTELQLEQPILKCSNFRKYLFEEGGMSSTPNKSTGINSYHVPLCSNKHFKNATKSTIDSFFRTALVLDRVVNYTRDEVEIALKKAKKRFLYQCCKTFTCLMILIIFMTTTLRIPCFNSMTMTLMLYSLNLQV